MLKFKLSEMQSVSIVEMRLRNLRKLEENAIIVEKENDQTKNRNIKILNRWTKKEIIKQDLVEVKNLYKSFDDNFFTENSKNILNVIFVL